MVAADAAGEVALALIDKLPWILVIALAATLGLAPVIPEPHIVEKLRMLAQGELRAPLDIFDLVMHGVPWLLLALKGVRELRR